jgi:hypothetical protein
MVTAQFGFSLALAPFNRLNRDQVIEHEGSGRCRAAASTRLRRASSIGSPLSKRAFVAATQHANKIDPNPSGCC